MKKYNAPEIKVLKFCAEDVITLSNVAPIATIANFSQENGGIELQGFDGGRS